MQPQTLATLKKLEETVWFSRVGKSDSSSVVMVPGWDAAIESCSSEEWENLCLEATNQYRERLAERDPERLKRWNEIVEEVKKYSIPLVREKTEFSVRENGLPKSFEDTVQWDILHLCMEAEYADVYPPGFYASQAYWYLKGHFPCGWDGKFPEGRLVVF